jgi:hypothetical protein
VLDRFQRVAEQRVDGGEVAARERSFEGGEHPGRGVWAYAAPCAVPWRPAAVSASKRASASASWSGSNTSVRVMRPSASNT